MTDLVCPDCGCVFCLRNEHLAWLAEGKKRNPKLEIICSWCGYKIHVALMLGLYR